MSIDTEKNLGRRLCIDQGGLLDQLKKALGERALNAEMNHYLAGDGRRRGTGLIHMSETRGPPQLSVDLVERWVS